MKSIAELRAGAREHAKQIEAVIWLKTSDLVARWGVDAPSILAIPRPDLPYIEFGASKQRRYSPDDVTGYEQRAKQGEAA